jgi:hypothetical protein
MMIFAACVLTIAVLVLILYVRPQDLPAAPPVSPFLHLDERKAAIYENLRDLQFEYRLGKLSDQDYQQTKRDLQRELAGVLAEIDKVKQQLAAGAKSAPSAPPAEAAAPPAPAPASDPARLVCPHCHAQLPTPMKFCGECGKPLTEASA